MKEARFICIGKLTSPHGVRGEMKLLPYLKDTSYLSDQREFYDSKGKRIPVISLRSGPKGYFLVKFEEVSCRNIAETWRGLEIYMDRSLLPQSLDEETYYIEDLVGLKAVINGDREKIFSVVAVHNFGAGDILEICDGKNHKSFLVPFRKTAVPTVSIEDGFLVIEDSFLLENESKPRDHDA